MRYLEPWEMEGENAIEVKVLDFHVAWSDSNKVFIFTGEKNEREDGYKHIGDLEWNDDYTETTNITRLHEFTLTWLKQNKPEVLK